MSMRLSGKTAFVTAAGQGIGRAAALAFSREGAQVIATDIDDELLRRLKQEEPRLECQFLDVRDRAAIESAAQAAGHRDILLNCAGCVPHGTILDCSEEEWQNTFEINLTSMFRIIKAFLPAMLAAGGGSIINIASVVSSVKGAPNRFAYGASKAGVVGLTKSVAADFVTRRIRCNAICPGTVNSPSLQLRLSARGDYDQAFAEMTARQPMARLGTPEEIAYLAVYLASDESAFTTGAVHLVDGGWST
jgi:2-keto-3-deoxy-L-fuconate dehydrogenase